LGSEVGDLIRRGLDEPLEMVNLAQEIEDIYIRKIRTLGYQPIVLPNQAYKDMKLQEYALGINNTIQNPKIKNYRSKELVH
jgi:hypothetical protein